MMNFLKWITNWKEKNLSRFIERFESLKPSESYSTSSQTPDLNTAETLKDISRLNIMLGFLTTFNFFLTTFTHASHPHFICPLSKSSYTSVFMWACTVCGGLIRSSWPIILSGVWVTYAAEPHTVMLALPQTFLSPFLSVELSLQVLSSIVSYSQSNCTMFDIFRRAELWLCLGLSVSVGFRPTSMFKSSLCWLRSK